MSAPLKGIKVLELARILAGPWAGQTLADLGADVIKVESPDGDDTRKWGPPFIGDPDQGGAAAYFHACNRGKRSVTANFIKPAHIKAIYELVKRADVLIENFKVGTLQKYGLDYAVLKELNPRLVYCSITGFGQTGPYAKRAGYDFIIQAMSGLMDVTGDPNGEPQKVGIATADIFTGLYSTIAIQAALIERQQTGVGKWIDMALFDCQLAVLANQAMNALSTGKTPKRLGNAHPNIAPYQTFAVKDGHLIIAVGNDSQFQKLCDVLQIASLKLEPRFETNASRVKNRHELTEILKGKIIAYSLVELLAKLEKAGVPAAPVNTVQQALQDPQILQRDLVFTKTTQVDSHHQQQQMYVGTPIKYVDSSQKIMNGTRCITREDGDNLASVTWQTNNEPL
ncbi:CaiB/BaiF CoA transferase family protein [Polycladidibacter stylochi]|uniref:CaiB/BaiF CoA transferase family protein n=1 Tax=Polycladidibacter stylochi TaxID=1807766 RepID=UPI000B0779F0|nr:CaiB/BaiF CoA-transferase family protein [Pseudovibrio stylochi]